MPDAIVRAYSWLQSLEFTQTIRDMAGIHDLIPVPFGHGGGIHVTDPGGYLGPHIDFAVCPPAPFLERRASLIVYLSAGDGGHLQLWNDDVSEVQSTIIPEFNRAVLFLNSDWSYHSVSPVQGMTSRASLAVYYCAPIRPGVTRKRALWVPDRKTISLPVVSG